jgi:hypothetical protein
MGKKARTPYAERSDDDKVRSQWRKLSGLLSREDWSAAIVRAATAAELSVSLAIRREFASRSNLSGQSVDALLKEANGLWGKVNNLLMPLLIDRPNLLPVRALCKSAGDINRFRNSIVHGGHFSNKEPASEAIEICRIFVNGMVQLYEPDFELKPPRPRKQAGKR